MTICLDVVYKYWGKKNQMVTKELYITIPLDFFSVHAELRQSPRYRE